MDIDRIITQYILNDETYESFYKGFHKKLYDNNNINILKITTMKILKYGHKEFLNKTQINKLIDSDKNWTSGSGYNYTKFIDSGKKLNSGSGYNYTRYLISLGYHINNLLVL